VGGPARRAGLGRRARAHRSQRHRPPGRPTPAAGPDPRGRRRLAVLEQITARYRNAARVSGNTLAIVVAVEAEKGRIGLDKQFGGRIAKRHEQARRLRADAIARYEKFLAEHPDDPAWTPEILFRLAELHFENDSERFAREEDAYEDALLAFEARDNKKDNDPAPSPPQVSYDRSVALFRQLIERFPAYVHSDAALYMLALLRFEEERFDDARQSLLALACASRYAVPTDGAPAPPRWRRGDYSECIPRRAGSKYIAEAWLRVGEIHYDLDEFDPALAAYTEAARDTQGQFYDEAMLRIAWTLYLKRNFADAATKLDEFVRFIAELKKTDPDNAALALRDDAIRYIAKCYVEEDWDLDGNPDNGWGLPRLDRDYKDRGGEPHVPEVYAALGDLFANQDDWKLAIKIYDTALSRWPTTAAAPALQKKVLDAYVALGDNASVRRTRELLASNYLRGTPWFFANEGDTDAIESAMKLVEDALVASAVERHAYAQTLRAAGDPKATDEYRAAALAYEAYLARYPDTPSSYQYRYDYAESLFYSGQHLLAAQAYTAVRDSNTSASRQVDAAEGVVLALEAHLEDEQKAGRVTLPDMPKQGVAKGPFEPKEIPELLLTLQAAYDRYIGVKPDSKEAGALMFKAAALSQRYYHFDEAEDRLVQVVDTYCSDNIAINAGFAIVDGRVVREDLKGAQEWTEKLLAKSCGTGEESAKFAGDLKTLGNAVRFQEANLLFEAGEFEAAADRYVALVTGAPKDPNADRALNNAAVAYEEIGRFGSASKTYERIYKEYPDSEFADDALLRSGLNHVRFFEFDDAVTSYLMLAEDPRYKDSEHRLIALKNAADLLDNLQQYPKSSELFVRYASQTKDPKETIDATFRAAQVLRKTDNHRAAEGRLRRLHRQARRRPQGGPQGRRGPPAHRPGPRRHGRPQGRRVGLPRLHRHLHRPRPAGQHRPRRLPRRGPVPHLRVLAVRPARVQAAGHRQEARRQHQDLVRPRGPGLQVLRRRARLPPHRLGAARDVPPRLRLRDHRDQDARGPRPARAQGVQRALVRLQGHGRAGRLALRGHGDPPVRGDHQARPRVRRRQRVHPQGPRAHEHLQAGPVPAAARPRRRAAGGGPPMMRRAWPLLLLAACTPKQAETETPAPVETPIERRPPR
jgi:tetratricopeptide (TPR) repeat protein